MIKKIFWFLKYFVKNFLFIFLHFYVSFMLLAVLHSRISPEMYTDPAVGSGLGYLLVFSIFMLIFIPIFVILFLVSFNFISFVRGNHFFSFFDLSKILWLVGGVNFFVYNFMIEYQDVSFPLLILVSLLGALYLFVASIYFKIVGH